MAEFRFPGPPEFPRPGSPGWPAYPPGPGRPNVPGVPGSPDPVGPSRVWLDPETEWQDKLRERLLEKRIIMVSGILDDPAASRMSAQLLALDGDGDGPIRVEFQNLKAGLSAALSVMGVLDVVRAQVHACAGGEMAGAAVGVLASCPRRLAYPNATFTLTEPRMEFGGTVTAVTEREQHVRRMMDTWVYRIAEATGREPDEIRDDARGGRTLTVAEALGYGLIHERVTKPTA